MAIIGNIPYFQTNPHGSHQYTPVMLACFYQHHGSVMGSINFWIILIYVCSIGLISSIYFCSVGRWQPPLIILNFRKTTSELPYLCSTITTFLAFNGLIAVPKQAYHQWVHTITAILREAIPASRLTPGPWWEWRTWSLQAKSSPCSSPGNHWEAPGIPGQVRCRNGRFTRGLCENLPEGVWKSEETWYKMNPKMEVLYGIVPYEAFFDVLIFPEI